MTHRDCGGFVSETHTNIIHLVKLGEDPPCMGAWQLKRSSIAIIVFDRAAILGEVESNSQQVYEGETETQMCTSNATFQIDCMMKAYSKNKELFEAHHPFAIVVNERNDDFFSHSKHKTIMTTKLENQGFKVMTLTYDVRKSTPGYTLGDPTVFVHGRAGRFVVYNENQVILDGGMLV